jgi:hypothetical protein
LATDLPTDEDSDSDDDVELVDVAAAHTRVHRRGHSLRLATRDSATGRNPRRGGERRQIRR